MINDENNPDIAPPLIFGEILEHTKPSEQPIAADNLRALSFQHMQDGFLIVLPDGIHVDVNPAFCNMTGFSSEELIGAPPDHLYWPPGEREQIRSAFAETPNRDIAEVELIFMRKSGERFPVLVQPFAIRNQSGTIIYYATTIKDITQRKELQTTMVESEQRYRGLFENAADAIVILQGDKIVDFNQRASEVFGVTSLEQLTSRSAFNFFPPTQPNGQDSRKFSIEKVENAQARKGEFFAWHHVKFDGTPFDAEVSLSTFKLGDNLFVQAIIRDITQRKKVEQDLKDSEQRFRTLFNSAGDAILILKDDQVIDCNYRTQQLTGRSREEILSTPTADFFPLTQPNGQDSREFFAEQQNAAQLGIPKIFEWTGDVSGGAVVNTEVTMTTFMLGKTRYVQSVIRDITERKRLEEALRRSEQRYYTLFETAGDGILIMQGAQVLDCNERVLEIYGISRDELMNLSNYCLSPTLQPNGQSSPEFFAEKIAALQSENPQIFEWTANRLDGTSIETEVTLTELIVDGETCTQSLIRDTTRRKHLEIELKNSEVRFRTLFENAGDAISIMKDSRIIDCNKRLCELYGRSRDDILAAITGDYFPPTQPNGQDSIDFFRAKVKASRSGNPQVYEWHGRKSDGTAIVTEVNLTTLVLGDQIFEQAIARDITQRKHMQEALLDLNRTLEDRVARRTEELEVACAELLLRNSQYRALAKKLTQAEEEERKRIARLLHDNHQQLLVAAKFKAEMLVSNLYRSDVNAAGAQIVEILEQALDVTRSLTMQLAPPILYGAGFVTAMQWLADWMAENHQLQVLVIGSLPVTPLPLDVSSLLFRSVRELLFNVVKHAGVTQARVDIVAFDQGLRVTVSDEGSGFDVADVLQIPHSYGLFSIQEQLTSLDGRLDISSAPHSGTICTVSIPVASEAGAYAAVASALEGTTMESADTQHAPRSAIRILVADDHALARDALVQILGLMDDFEVVGEAVDGLDAVEKACAIRPDVVLMDATMPRLNGLDATRRITTEVPGIKVIGLSMHAREDMEPQMIAAGATSYLQKLTPADELFCAIRRAMNRDTAETR